MSILQDASRRVDCSPAAVADDLRPAVAEGFHGLAAGTRKAGAARRVDVVPRLSETDGCQPFREVDPVVVERRNDDLTRKAEAPAALPLEEFGLWSGGVGSALGAFCHPDGLPEQLSEAGKLRDGGLQQAGDAVLHCHAAEFEEGDDFAIGRLAGDSGGVEQQPVRSGVPCAQPGVGGQCMERRGDQRRRVVVDPLVERLYRAGGVLVGRGAQFGAALPGEGGEEHCVEVDRVELALRPDNQVLGLQIPVGRIVGDQLGGQRVVQAFSHEAESLAQFDEINDRLTAATMRATFFSSMTNPSTRIIYNIIYACVGFTGALSAVAWAITVGGLSCFLSYANQYAKPFNEISGVVTELQNALACAARVFELLDAEDQTPEAENAAKLVPDGHVQIEDVSFRYLPDRPLIESLSLDVKPGQRIAIVGPTGCGKTTLINLLMRFYDVNGGSIKVSGTDIRDVTRASLRGSYGMVLQDTWLRAGTVRENIAYGKPDATDEEIIAAAKAAHADSFIRRLPNGYDTVIAEDGGNISQGQKQLLCIARVMLCLPPMLILDEATSSIDTRTEVRIQAAFARMMQGRTSFIVAHRLSTIREADVILVMKDGHIVEQGDHDELLAQGGFYAKLYNSQFEGVET